MALKRNRRRELRSEVALCLLHSQVRQPHLLACIIIGVLISFAVDCHICRAIAPQSAITYASPQPLLGPLQLKSRRSALLLGSAVLAETPLGGTASAEETAATGTASRPKPPKWADELQPWPGGWFDDRKPPDIRWQPQEPSTDVFGDSLIYPDWMLGTWKVAYKKEDVRFPQGWGMLNPSLPGVAMASILRLPNVGAEPTATWRFVSSEDSKGSRPDWSLMLPSVLEAFWDTAKSSGSAFRQPGTGWVLTYKSPTAFEKGNLTERDVSLTWLGGEVWQEGSDSNSLISVEWIRQRDKLQDPAGVADYKVLMALQKNAGDVPSITGFMRIAAFLQPVDTKYIEAEGRAAAVYEYSLTLSPQEAEDLK
eukprot:TRINITY_DN52353_c0_g1_i1.p1 TRINITY_DN52353_c0_g1~~TRINITY_DN52353_c0_g1_i1.p1  ORF type:complete len:387 (-),score=79.67 TRINITY_DN52353_c0_g1_i1:172-1272(-)